MGSTVPVAVIAPLTNYLIVKKHFKSLSRINTASVHIVLNIDTPTQMLPSLVGEKYKVLGQERRHMLSAKPLTEMRSSL
jgi:hypothetical protein